MQNNVIKSLLMGILLFGMSTAQILAFPSAATHYNGMGELGGVKDLIGTPVSKGGVGNVFPKKTLDLFKWMDNPATQTGSYINHKAGGGPVNPLNHGASRHNPQNVKNVFKWPGSKNVARMHKIQDMAHNSFKSNIDGFKPTPKMRKEAQVILRYVRRYKKLPKRLPAWVDATACSIRKSSAIKSLSAGGRLVVKSPLLKSSIKAGGKLMKVAGKIALPVAITAEAALLLYGAHTIEELYCAGEIDIYERNLRHGGNLGSSIGSGIAIAAGFIITTIVTPAGPVAVIATIAGTIVAIYALEYVGEKIGRYLASVYNAHIRAEIARCAAINQHYYASVGIIPMTTKQMAQCGFTAAEIKGNLMAIKMMKTSQSSNQKL